MVEAGCIEHLQSQCTDLTLCTDEVSGRALDVSNESFLPAGETIKESAFAGVGRADENSFAAVNEQFCDLSVFKYAVGVVFDLVGGGCVYILEPLFCFFVEAGVDLICEDFCSFDCFGFWLG